MIGRRGERGSGISVLAARHDGDDDDVTLLYTASGVLPSSLHTIAGFDNTGCNPEDLPEPSNDREMWRERVRDIRASRTT